MCFVLHVQLEKEIQTTRNRFTEDVSPPSPRGATPRALRHANDSGETAELRRRFNLAMSEQRSLMRARYGDGGGPSFASSMSFHAGGSRRESERSSASGSGGGAMSARESERSSGDMIDDLLERGVRRGRTSDLERLEEMMLKEAIRLSMEDSNGTKAAATTTAKAQGTADVSTSAATSSDAGTGLSPTTVIGGADTSSSLSGGSQGPVSPKRTAGQGVGASASARLASAISGTTSRSPSGAGSAAASAATTTAASPAIIKKDMRMTAPYRRDAEMMPASSSGSNDGDNDDYDDDDEDDDDEDEEEEEGEEVSEKRYREMLTDPNLPRMLDEEDAEVQLQLAIALSLAESPDKTSSKEKSTTATSTQPPQPQPAAVSAMTTTSSPTSSSGPPTRLSPSVPKSSSSSSSSSSSPAPAPAPAPSGKVSPVPSRDPSVRAMRIAAHSSAFDGAYELPFDVKKPKTPPISPAPPAIALAQSEVAAKKDLGGLLEKIDQALGTPPSQSQSQSQSRSISPSAAAIQTSSSSSGMYPCMPFHLIHSCVFFISTFSLTSPT